ncbi:PrgI family mobile element protein [Patescibacteria group bacterium]
MAIKDVQKTHTQHAVPQNIMDVEFKLIGDLTMRQFTYLMVFGLVAYIIFMTAVGIFRLPLAFFFVLFGLALAFVPIEERGMDEWFVNFFKAVYSPTQRIWKKETVLPPAFTYQNLAVVKQELITLAPTSSRRKLEDYLRTQQSAEPIDRLDIPESEYILKVRRAFAPVATHVPVEVEQEAFESYKPQFVKEEPQQDAKQEPQKEQTPEQKKEEKPTEEKHEDKPKYQMQADPQAPIIKTQAAPTTVPPMAKQEKDDRKIVPKEEHKITSKMIMPKRSATSNMTFAPITPDMHVGRKFTNVLPAEGQLILPVRGEMVIATSEEVDIQKDIDEKTNQLRKLLDQVQEDKDLKPVLEKKKEEEKPAPPEKPQEVRLGELPVPPPVEPKPPPKEEVVKAHKTGQKAQRQKIDIAQIRKEAQAKRQKIDEAIKAKQAEMSQGKQPQEGELSKAQEVAERVKQENEHLTGEIDKLRAEIENSQESPEQKEEKRKRVEALEQEKSRKSSDYSALQQQVLELQKRIAEKETPKKAEEPAKPSYSKMQPITSEPNIVSGVIRGSDGEALTGVVLLIKNNKGEAVRALKTNALGQFSISTPLMNSLYTLEVGSAVENTTFDIITIEVKGEVLPPVELSGREV